MASKLDDETKLKVLARFATGDTVRQVADFLELPYSQVLKLHKEYVKADEAEVIQSMVDVDSVIVHRIADEMKTELSLIDTSQTVIDSVNSVVNKIDSYQLLNTKVHATAVTLVDKIENMARDPHIRLGAMDLQTLVESLTKIQNAFFNKNTNNINILNQQVSGSKVDTFKSFRRD